MFKKLRIKARLKKKISLFKLFWTRIVFVRNHHKVPFLKKLKANFSGGYLGDQYILYDFDNVDKSLYLSEFDWYKSRYINTPYNMILNNKLVCNDMLKQYIGVPEIFFIKASTIPYSYLTNESTTPENILEKLREEKSLFMKPINAGKGKNVFMLSYENNKYKIDKDFVDENVIINLLEETNRWLISETVKQAQYLNDIYNKTTNTIRMITTKDYETNIFSLLFAVQRIGTYNTIPVDNGSRGGLVCKVDLETGELSEAKSLHSLEVHEFHPDSGAQLKGAKIPNWNNIKKEIVDLANQFPYLKFIAWDVLITEEGPVIIEANTSSGVNIIQIWGGQRNGPLGDFYRQYDII